ICYLLKFLSLVEVWHLSTAEDVVDVLKKSLLHRLDVVKQEHLLDDLVCLSVYLPPCLPVCLSACLSIYLLTVPELLLAVVLADLNLEHGVVAQEGGEAGQTLAPAASDTDEQHVPPRLPDHAHDLGDWGTRKGGNFLNGHQVHGHGVRGVVVVVEHLGHELLQLLRGGNVLVYVVRMHVVREQVYVLPETLVDPESGHGWLCVVVVLVGPHSSSTHSGDVPHVEQVVDLGRGGEEPLHDGVVHLDGRLRHDVADGLHLLLKVLQLLVDHAAKDSLDLRLLMWERHVDEVEPALQAPRDDHPATPRGSHGRHEQHVLDVLDGLALAVIPKAVVDPQLYQFQRRLTGSTEQVCYRHIEIVQESDHFLSTNGNIDAFGAFFHARLNDVLDLVRGGLSGQR
ncbi:hypothetical protein EGW08_016014, partial [Elysia chlorotica]